MLRRGKRGGGGGGRVGGKGREEKVMGDKCVYRDGSVISVHFVFFFFFFFHVQLLW